MKHVKMMGSMWLGLVVALSGSMAETTDTRSMPPLEVVSELIRAHLPGVTEAELNVVLVQALVDHFHPRVAIVDSDSTEPLQAPAGVVSRTAVFERELGYVRVQVIGPGLDEQLIEGLRQLESTNQLQGVVLDLRFAGGVDYATAGRAAQVFVTGGKPLLSWGETTVSAMRDDGVVTLPLVVLINAGSAGAAEALAGALREGAGALLIGSQSAGQAYVYRDFDIPGDRQLRVASEPVYVGNGKSLAGGLKPDIEVSSRLEDERVHLADPYAVIPGVGTGVIARSSRTLVNEAELMRQRELEKRPATNPSVSSATPAGPEEAVMQDQALSRGLDLLKGIVIVSRVR
jgi:hypothetical protein